MLPDDRATKDLEGFFSNDVYATQVTKCRIVEGWKGHGVAELDIEDMHRNALGAVMGGVIFTLADFAFAIASNAEQDPTVNLTTTIDYLSSSKGSKLTAVAESAKDGRRIAFYDVKVTDDEGVLIAKMSVTGYRHTQAR